ncbi:hypothetical protein WDW37_21675 [Bdellovibrionota bacterium FG-1]
MTWKMAAKACNKTLETYFTPKDFFATADALDRKTPVYIDANLAEGVQGTEVAKQVAELGFRNIFLATGREPDFFGPQPHLKGILGKDPPWSQ